MHEIVVVGIGNPFRSDDGAGWAVIDALDGKLLPPVKLVKLRGGISELMELFASASSLFLIDACSMDAPAGVWKRIDAHLEPLSFDNPQTSTHGLSLKEAIALGKNLEQLPPKLILYVINGKVYEMGDQLSPPVAQAIERVAQNLINEKELHACMKKA